MLALARRIGEPRPRDVGWWPVQLLGRRPYDLVILVAKGEVDLPQIAKTLAPWVRTRR